MVTLTKEQINELTKVAEWVKHTPIGYVTQDSAGKIKTTYTNRNTHLWDLTGLSSNNGGGTIGNPDNPDNPGQSDEDNYYAGSLANGEITDRDLLWAGPSNPTKATSATLVKDPGSKFNMIGEGVQISAHLLKTVMTNGVKASISTVLPIAYDPTNTAKAGYYVSTSSYPAYVLASHFVVGKRLTVPFNGIGEHINGKNVKAPAIHLTFNDDKTITIENETGYDNDGNSAGATGANYDVVVDMISTYSTQTAVSQLPTSINLFVGSASGKVVLSGASDYFENVMDGIEVTVDDYAYYQNYERIALADINMPTVFRIPKDRLVNGFKFDLVSGNDVASKFYENSNKSNIWIGRPIAGGRWMDHGTTGPFRSATATIEVGKSYLDIESNFGVYVQGESESMSATNFLTPFSMRINKVVPFKQ